MCKVEKPVDNKDPDSCACKYVRFGGNLRTLDSMLCLCANFSLFLYFVNMSVFVCTPSIFSAHRSQKSALDPLELELQIFVICHVENSDSAPNSLKYFSRPDSQNFDIC